MKFHITIDVDYIVIVYPEILDFEGLIELSDLLETQLTPEQKQFNRIHDIRGTTSNLINHEHLRTMAKHRNNSKRKGIWNAYVVKDALQFGMVRMWQALVDRSSDTVEIFYQYDKALDYIKNCGQMPVKSNDTEH